MMRPIPYNPSDGEKIEGLNHVWYEVDLVHRLGFQKPWDTVYDYDVVDRNAYADNTARFEGFLLHVRNLLDFFESPHRSTKGNGKEENDDILASDYGFKTSRIDFGIDVRIPLNKYLAHLSYARTKRPYPKQEWTRFADRLIRPLLVRCIDFVAFIVKGDKLLVALPEAQRSKWQQLESSLEDWRKELEGIDEQLHSMRQRSSRLRTTTDYERSDSHT